MSPAEVAAWLPTNRAEYVRSRIQAGESREQAETMADRQFAEYFPQDRPGPHHRLLVVERAGSTDDHERVGLLWLGPHPQRTDDDTQAWIYDIEIDEQFRGQGLGRATLSAAEQLLAADGVVELSLNVFGHNATARRLYTTAGFDEVAVIMSKKIDRD